MKFPYYTTTALEDIVTQWYIQHEFFHPEDLDIKDIGWENEISLQFRPIQASYIRIGNIKSIVVDSRLPNVVQREQFFHELCHALRHAGCQSMMPKDFYELQERDAKHFTLYAALPSHMIQDYSLHSPNIIEQWSKDFKIPSYLCAERLEQIKRRVVPNINP
ncbi:hypothetical protein GCM10007216_30220 [Thalassobacillus devorans]|uniref:IrrE N-terminal-like domain-containing protein n=1 Tax=Thalassobacillus devorans TaxID=279813 RepID=A0ABQ1PHH1_9BACI|nr:ImmA/IrrE family metallo-endopeptidase [Thalassobacillus devorans]NIK29983.1 Zn-dependent peptidase ImmA (M78 family) [Thalassobacillus devorans]GGC97397.1 hypothetical protein GCM10007216_30220 [Thalassobacillus devorans]